MDIVNPRYRLVDEEGTIGAHVSMKEEPQYTLFEKISYMWY